MSSAVHVAVLTGTVVSDSGERPPHMSTLAEPTSADVFEIVRSDTPVPDAQREADLAAPKFGTVFTDHMARVSYAQETGWSNRRVVKYGPLQMDPATAVLHYAQEIFEGLKAYKHPDGSVWTFRPRGQRRAVRPLGPPARAAAAVRGGLPGCDPGPRRDGSGVGAGRRGDEPVPATVHVRLRDVPRGAAVARGRVPGHRVARRPVLRRWGPAGVDLGRRGLPPCGRRRDR